MRNNCSEHSVNKASRSWIYYKQIKYYSLFRSRNTVNFDEQNEVSSLVVDKSCFMRSIAVHLLLIYSNDLKTHMYFFK